MPLASTRSQAFHIASGSAVGKPIIWRAMAFEDCTAASTFALPMPKS